MMLNICKIQIENKHFSELKLFCSQIICGGRGEGKGDGEFWNLHDFFFLLKIVFKKLGNVYPHQNFCEFNHFFGVFKVILFS